MGDWLKSEKVRLGAAIALFVLSSLYLIFNSSLIVSAQWVGVAVWLISGSALFSLLKHQTPDRGFPSWARKLAPYAAITLAVCWTLYPIPFELPINQDHAHHYFATDVWIHDVLLSGHIFGWSDRIAGGMPLGDVYGTPVYIVTSALYLLTFGLVSLQTSYSFGILVVWLFLTWGIAALTRRILPNSQLAPFIGGLAALWDPGGDREAGWVYSMFHAVWPQLMGTAMLVWALVALLSFVKNPSRRRFAAAALLTGGCAWMHPMNSLNLAIFAPTFTLVVLASAWKAPKLRLATFWLAPLFLISSVIAFGCFAHLYKASAELAQYSAHGPSIHEFAASLLSGSPFANGVILLGTIGLVGLAALTRIRTLPALAVTALFVVFVWVASMEVLLLNDLGLSEFVPQIMFRRFLISAKPFWFVMVGVGAGTLWAGLKTLIPESSEGAAWPFALALAPLLLAMWGALSVLVPTPIGGVIGYEASGIGANLDNLTTLLIKEKTELKLERPMVVDWTTDRHGDYELISYADAGFGYLATRKPPCQALKTVMFGKNLTRLQSLGATHIVSRTKRSFPGTKLVGTVGTFFYLYRFTKPDFPANISGGGTLEVTEWSNHHRVLKVSGEVTHKSRITLGMPLYSKWKATQNGRVLSLDVSKRGSYSWIQFSPSAGNVELVFEDSRFEIIVFVLCIIFCLLMWLLIVTGGTMPPLVPERFEVNALWAVSVLAVLVVLGSLVVLHKLGSDGQTDFWLKKSPSGTEVLAVLHRESPARFNYSPKPYCVRAYSRKPRTGCIESSLEPQLVAGKVRSAITPSCLRFGIADKGQSSLRYNLPEGTTAIKGYWSVKGKVSATLKLGKESKKLTPGAFSMKVKDLAALELSAKNTGSTAFGCLEIVALGDSE